MTLEERARYIEDHVTDIPVRVLVSGRWTNEYLINLPARLAIREAFRLLLSGPDIPHRRVAAPEPDDSCPECGGRDRHSPACTLVERADT